MLTGADFVSKISHAQRIKQLGSRLGSMVLPEFPKAERKREKAPKSYDFGAFIYFSDKISAGEGLEPPTSGL